MRPFMRTFVLLPVLVLAFVAIPAVVLAAAGGHSLTPGLAQPAQQEQGSTVPTPTPRPIPPAPVPPPPPPPHPAPPPPQPTAVPVVRTAQVNNIQIARVIGDPLSSTIYAYLRNGWLYRSTNDGAFWSLVATQPFVQDFVMSAADPMVLYSGQGPNCLDGSVVVSPMYRSEDGGETWTELVSGIGLKPLLIDPSDANRVFAADCASLYLSTDGGQTWLPKPAGADSLWQTFAPAGMSSGSLVGSPAPTEPHWDQLFGIGNNAQGAGAIAFSGDQGDSWADITNVAKAPIGAKIVLASLRTGGTVWLVDAKGVWSSTDYGVTWTFSNQGLEYLVKVSQSPLNDLIQGEDGKLYLATNQGMYFQESPDSGWRKPSDDDVSFNNRKIVSLLNTHTHPTMLWLNGEDRDGNQVVYTYAIGQ